MAKESNYFLTKSLSAKKFKEVCQFFETNNLEEFFLNEGGTEIVLKKKAQTTATVSVAASETQSFTQVAPVVEKQAESEPEDETGGNYIESPIAGTYYSSPSPDAASFVKLGDKVKKGQVICIIEAMKIMNEITSTHDGVVSKFIVENASPVNQGAKLIELK